MSLPISILYLLPALFCSSPTVLCAAPTPTAIIIDLFGEDSSHFREDTAALRSKLFKLVSEIDKAPSPILYLNALTWIHSAVQLSASKRTLYKAVRQSQSLY